MIFRKKIFMGECPEGAVYYNTKTHEILVADKSKLLNMEKSKNNGKYAAIGTGILILILPMLKITDINIDFGKLKILIAWIVENAFLCLLIEVALYKNVKNTKLATRQQFRQAIYGNTLWNNFENKRVTKRKKIFFTGLIFVFH